MNTEIKTNLKKFANHSCCGLESYIKSLNLTKTERIEAAKFYWDEYNHNDVEWYSQAATCAIASEFGLDIESATRIVDSTWEFLSSYNRENNHIFYS